jgi:phospholipid-transporting ATPase
LQCIKAVSITSGVPTTALPLAFVLFVTAVKDAIEDFNRHRADATENNRLGHVLIKEKHFDLNHAHPTKWYDIKVGDVVVIKNRELIPSDIVLLASSEPSGLAFVMTANLDGETNLKAKEVHQGLRQLPLPAKLAGATVVCDLPNNNLEHFEGLYTLGPEVGERKVPLTQRNILLRGCMLRNTTWAVGVVVYTGKETKIQMNAAETAQKIGSVRRFVDRETVMVFGLQVLCCLCAAVVGGIYVGRGGQMPYLWVGAGLPDPALSGFIQFWTYTVLFSNMLPISCEWFLTGVYGDGRRGGEGEMNAG